MHNIKLRINYRHYNFKKLLLFASFLVVSFYPTIYAQENNVKNDVKHSINLRHDNDFLAFTDKYYTSGLFLSYSQVLDHPIFHSGQEQISIALVQQIYTPLRLSTSNIAEIDRPYAGYLEVNTGWSYAKDTHGFDTNFSLGIVGKASGSGSFHQWYHNALGIPQAPTWAYELENKVHANLYTSYMQEWQLSPNNFSVYLAIKPSFALGTKDIYAQPEIMAHFGKRQSMTTSMAYNRFGSTEREIFFTLRAGYRFVNHNALLEGHILGDDSVFLVQPENSIFYGGFDLKHRLNKNEYWLGYRFNSAETKQTKLHKYFILSYARSF